MIELSHEQASALHRLMGSTKGFLGTVECANGPAAAVRDSIIEDCETWLRILVDKQNARAAHQEGVKR